MRFPRSIFRDYQSTRQGLLSHNKILYARGKQRSADGKVKDIAWAYVGSANMSQSAWGQMVYDKKAKAWKVNCRNWECGVLLPMKLNRDTAATDSAVTGTSGAGKAKVAGEDSETESEDEAEIEVKNRLVGMEVFDDLVRPPFRIPSEPYNGREPWYFQEYN